MSHNEFLTVLLFGAIGVGVFLYRRRNSRTPGAMPVIMVGRPIAPPSNVFRNIVVLAALVGLAWYVYGVLSTHCWGAC